MRQALGTAVFFGMVGVTFFGLVLTPVFYVAIRWLSRVVRLRRRPKKGAGRPREVAESAGKEPALVTASERP
jgi:hypothetical protein